VNKAALVLAALMAVQAHAASPSRVTVALSARQNDHAIHCTLHSSASVARKALGILSSSTYEAPPEVAREHYSRARSTDHVRLVFSRPQTVRMKSSTTGPAQWHALPVRELLLPMSEVSAPRYAIVKSGKSVRAFSKFHSTPVRQVQRAIAKAELCR